MPLSRVKLLRDHNQTDPVGYLLSLAPDGVTATFKVAEGENGDRALREASPETKLRDGLSVGVQVLPDNGSFEYDAKTKTYHVYAAELVEVSLCAIPAFQDASVTSVNAHHTNEKFTSKEKRTVESETVTVADLDQALSANADEFERMLDTRLATISSTPVDTGPTWPTFGAFVKELITGNSDALELYNELAYGGAKSSDSVNRNVWIDDAIHLVDRHRPVTNTFTRETLPDEGMTLEYLQLKSNSMAVEKQSDEGENLKFGRIQLKSDTTPVATYGGYTELTKQIIDRANAAYVTTAFKAMDIEYGRATEAVSRALLKAVIATQITAGNKLAITAGANAYAWLDLIVDAAIAYDERGYVLAGSFVSADVFKALIRLEDTKGNSLMRVYGQGINQTGELDLTHLEGNLASVTFKLLPGADANTMTFYDPLAITTWESAGAPHQLQSENVINLSNAFSKYGYLAAASQFPQALLPVVIAPKA